MRERGAVPTRRRLSRSVWITICGRGCRGARGRGRVCPRARRGGPAGRHAAWSSADAAGDVAELLGEHARAAAPRPLRGLAAGRVTIPSPSRSPGSPAAVPASSKHVIRTAAAAAQAEAATTHHRDFAPPARAPPPGPHPPRASAASRPHAAVVLVRDTSGAGGAPPPAPSGRPGRGRGPPGPRAARASASGSRPRRPATAPWPP